MPSVYEGKIEDAGIGTRGGEQWWAIELNNSKRAVCCEPGIMPLAFSHFAVAGYPVAVVKVQEQIKVK